MPFPWKKAKVSRISRLVNGLHRSSKRGESLVVETGFPTSLIDLFVKNRDRLRKSSRRKSSPQILNLPTHLQSDPTRSHHSPPCNEELQSPDTDVHESVSITRKNDDDDKNALHLVLKISLMVALAVSTSNLAIWIMMAAFLLVLLERFWGFLGPEYWIRKGPKSRANDELIVKQRETEFTDPCVLIELEEGRKTETITTSKIEPSRSTRIKTSLIKKFVPKKLRQRKRKSQEKLEKEKHEEEGEEQEETEVETEPVTVSSSTCDQNLQVESERGNLRKGDLGYMILFIVILAGLIGGRGFSLLFTLLCCLIILIYIGKTRKSVIGFN